MQSNSEKENSNAITIEFHTLPLTSQEISQNDSKIQEEVINPQNEPQQDNIEKSKMDTEMLLESNDLKEIEREIIKFNYNTRINFQKVPKIVKNRRYKKLQELIDEDDYFSETSIKHRAPILFEMYVGRYVRGSNSSEIISFSDLLINTEHNNKHQRIVGSYISQYPDAMKWLKEHKELPLDQMDDNEDS